MPFEGVDKSRGNLRRWSKSDWDRETFFDIMYRWEKVLTEFPLLTLKQSHSLRQQIMVIKGEWWEKVVNWQEGINSYPQIHKKEMVSMDQL